MEILREEIDVIKKYEKFFIFFVLKKFKFKK